MSVAEQLSNKLLKDTHLENIKWSLKEPPYNIINQSEDYIPIYFETKFKDKIIGLYERRYKYYTDVDEFSWSVQDMLCIVNYDNSRRISIWEGSGGKVTSDLLDLVKVQASGIHDLLG